MKKIAIIGFNAIGRTSLTNRITGTNEATFINEPVETIKITAPPQYDELLMPSEYKCGKQLRRERRKNERKRY